MKSIITSLLTKQITIGSIVLKAGTVVATAAAVVVVGGTAGAVALHSMNATDITDDAPNAITEVVDTVPGSELYQSEAVENGGGVEPENTGLPEISHEHHYKTEILSQSTCTVQGEAAETCTECGYSESYRLPLAGHVQGEWTEVLAATTTTEGLREAKCINCGTILAQEIIAIVPHDHVYVLDSGAGASCESSGYRNYHCTVCGSYYSETVDATGHHYDQKITEAATCTSEGHVYEKCSDCGKTREAGIIAAKGHTETDPVITKKATCTEPGSYTYTCADCGSVIADNVIAPLGHSYGEPEITDSTCSEEGNKKYTCEREGCDYSYEETITRKGHVESDWITDNADMDIAATCMEAGLRHTECTVCHAVMRTEEIPATGHSFDEWTETRAAECEIPGEEKKVCSACGTEETRKIPALGHLFVNYVVVTPATDLAEGLERAACENGCGQTEERTIARLPHVHDYNKEKTRVEATCTEDGYYVLECRCGSTMKTDIAKTGHTYEKTAHVDADCISEGADTFTCSKCDDSYGVTIPATGHTAGEWEIEKAATDLEAGQKVRKCTACGTTLETQTISRLPHTCKYTTLLESQPVTCTTDGYELYECRCGLTDKVILPRTNHKNAEWKVTREATYTEMGLKEKICPDCQVTLETEEIPVKPHEHTYRITYSKDATCTDDGIAVNTCSICGKTTEVITPATGHTESDFIVDREAACTETGERHTECQVCHITMKTETISAVGHDYGDWIIDKEATEEAEGEKHKECNRCDSRITEDIEKLSPHVHDYVETAREDSSCSKTGTITYTCECGGSYTEEIAKKAHTPGEWTVKSPATEESEGLEVRSCTECGMQTDSRMIEKLPHTHNYVTDTKAATCTTDGYVKKTCACGSVINAVIRATGHHYAESEKQAATCGIAGFVTYKCTNCNDSYTETLEKLKHDYTVTSTVDATCTEDGYTLETCKNCGDTRKTNVTQATGHDDGEWETVQEAELGVAGSKELRCTRCRALLDTEEIPMLTTDGTDSVYYFAKENNEQGMVIGHYNEEEAQEMLELVNEYRTSIDRHTLEMTSAQMNSYVAMRAVETSYLWDHTRPNGGKSSYSENIAMGNPDAKGNNPSVQQIFEAWLNSPGHKANLDAPKPRNLTGISVFYKRCPVYKDGVETGRYVYIAYWVEIW